MLAEIEQVENQTFDYVVAGGGLSGLVVATRLSEDPLVSVLVIEAGESNAGDPEILTPARIASHFGNDLYDWNYQTVKQVSLNGQGIPWPRGKGLGGSSAINFLQFHRPSKTDIDAFEKLGNGGWNWDRLKPYYQKAEKFIPGHNAAADAIMFDSDEHGRDGPITTSYAREVSGLEAPFQQALEIFGLPRVKEPFSGDTRGSWITPISVNPNTGNRSYAANAYYEPNASRPNLLVLTGAHIIEIATSIGEGELLRAESIAFMHRGRRRTVNVGKEVILSAGAIGTPQILELSGIGHPHVLSKAGVTLKKALLGVGNNVQEHVRVNTAFEMLPDPTNKYQTMDCLLHPGELERQSEIYRTARTGVLAMLPPSFLVFAPLSTVAPPESYELLQKGLATSLSRTDGQYSASVHKQHIVQLDHIEKSEPSCEFTMVAGLVPDILPNVRPTLGTKYGSIVCLINHPFSRGTIHISSSAHTDPPVIDPRYFEEQYDLKTMVEGIKFARRLIRTGPLKDIFSGVEACPGPEYNTDDKLEEYIKRTLLTTYHTVGSCSMLPLEDDGVVDTNLKVYGTQNIRVVDASIIPLHIGAHVQATVYAIAELAADIIKGHVSM